MFAKFVIWILNIAFNGKNRNELEPCIKELYRRMAQDDLKIKSEIVKVIKGKRRYDLLFMETKNGQLKFNLSRHWETNSPLELAIN